MSDCTSAPTSVPVPNALVWRICSPQKGPICITCGPQVPMTPTVSPPAFASVLGDHAVDEAVLDGFVGLEEAVALHVGVHALLRLPRVLGVDLVDALARLDDLVRVDLDVGRLPLE